MLRRIGSFLILLACFAAFIGPAGAQEISISGYVVDAETKEPIEGAVVSLLTSFDSRVVAERFWNDERIEERLLESQANAGGFYQLTAPEIGLYYLLIEAPGYRTVARPLEPLIGSETMPTAPLVKAVRIMAEALDEKGQPIAEARFLLTARPKRERRRMRRRLPWFPKSDRAHGGDDGKVTLIAGPNEELTLTVTAPERATVEVELSEGQKKVSATLRPGVAHRIRLVDEKNQGLPDVLLRHADHFPLDWSDEEGWLTVWVDETPLRLAAEAGEKSAVLGLDAIEGDGDGDGGDGEGEGADEAEPEVLLMQLEQPASLSGTVLDRVNRRPIAGALVWPSGRASQATRTDNRGTYSLPAGHRWLGAAAPGFRADWAEVEADASDQGPSLVLEPASSVAGLILDIAGEPIAEAEITIHIMGERRSFRTGTGRGVSTPDGRFTVFGLPVEKGLELHVKAPSFATGKLSLDPLEVGELRDGLELRLERALSAVGQVVDESERPVPGAVVDLIPQVQSADFRTIMRRMREEHEPNNATTGEDGRFRIDNLDPDTYRLTAKAAGFAPAKVPGLEMEKGAGEVDLGTIVVVPGLTLEGRVTDPDGRALAEVKVQASLSGRDMAAMIASMNEKPFEDMTDAEGRFSFEDLLPEEALKINLEKDGWAADPVDVTTKEDQPTLELVMQPGARLIVTVRDGDGSPVEKAMVVAKKPGAMFGAGPQRQQSTASGRAEIENLVPGRFDLEVSAEGFRPFARTGIDVTPGLDPIDVVLEKGLSVRGVVYSPEGTPLADAFVNVEEATPTLSMINRRHSSTDGEGRFTIGGVDPGPLQLNVHHEEYGQTSKRVDVNADVDNVEIRFPSGTEVSGQIIDGSTGAGVAGASVRLMANAKGNTMFFGRSSLEATTGPEGRFTIKNVAKGSYNLSANHSDFAQVTGDDVLEVDNLPVSGLVLEMGGGETIIGRVLGVEFDQLAKVSVMAVSPRGGFLQASLDYEGRFRLEHLAPGDWVIQASAPSGQQASERVVLEKDAGEVELELDFTGGVKITGTVMRAGSPVSGVDIRVINNQIFSFAQGRSDSQGRFNVEGLETGTYNVQVSSSSGEILHQEEIAIAGDDDWLLELKSGAVAGRVTSSSGEGLVGVAVSLRPTSAESEFSAAQFNPRTAATDSFGAFDLGQIAAGSYRLIATRSGYGRVEKPLEVESAPQRDLNIVMERTAGATLSPVRADGSRPNRVTVAVLDGNDQLLEVREHSVDENGLVHLDNLAAGTFQVLVAEGGGPTVSLPVQSPGDAGAITLPRGGLLRIEMPELFAENIHAKVEIKGADGRPYRSVEELSGWMSWLRGSEHRITLPAGSFSVRIEASDERTWEFPIAVTAGGETTLRVP